MGERARDTKEYGVPLAHVDLADAQAIRVRMRLDLEHSADEEAADIAVHLRHSDVEDTLDLEGRDRKAVGDLLGRRVDGDVLPQP